MEEAIVWIVTIVMGIIGIVFVSAFVMGIIEHSIKEYDRIKRHKNIK